MLASQRGVIQKWKLPRNAYGYPLIALKRVNNNYYFKNMVYYKNVNVSQVTALPFLYKFKFVAIIYLIDTIAIGVRIHITDKEAKRIVTVRHRLGTKKATTAFVLAV